MLIVSVALRTSAAPCGAKGSPPALPPPMAVYTSLTFGFFCTSSRAFSAAAKVCASVLPGGSEIDTCVCDRSSGGMKPVGSSGTSINEPTRNTAAASVVRMRCFRHQRAQPM